MAKSIRCKLKKRLRTAKRQRIDVMVTTPHLKEHHENLTRVAQGRTIEKRTPKNAFKYPKAPDAVFPQHEIIKPIDFRASHLPMAGYAFRGNRRKYDAEQTEFMKEKIATHPKMERLAGGGVVLAATGKKVSVAEAELIAASVQGAVGSDQLGAALAAAAAAAQASAPGGAPEAPVAAAAREPAPEGGADTSRRPVVKDTLRQQRAAEHKPRPTSGATKKRSGKRSAAEATEAYRAATAKAAEPAAPKPAALQAAASQGAADGDAKMTPASGTGPSIKVKKKGKKTSAA